MLSELRLSKINFLFIKSNSMLLDIYTVKYFLQLSIIIHLKVVSSCFTWAHVLHELTTFKCIIRSCNVVEKL